MRFRSLQLKDFRGFESLNLDLNRDLTVLIGANGAGKTSILDALRLLISEVMWSFYSGSRWDRMLVFHGEAVDVRSPAKSAVVKATVTANDDESSLEIPIDTDDAQRARWEETRGSRTQLTRFLSKAGDTPIFAIYSPSRRVERSWRTAEEQDPVTDVYTGDQGFAPFFRWFRWREDVENEQRVVRKDLSFEDPQLGAVRRTVSEMLPGYGELRVQRDPLQMLVTKGDKVLTIDQLSDGEKCTLAMAGDIARRLSAGKNPNPMLNEAVVVIDDVEIHLHPAWQRRVLGKLLHAFPNCQFIVSTHSPQVISEVPADSVFALDDFKVFRPPAPTLGRDSNAILREVMGVPERPEADRKALEHISDLLDNEKYDEARMALDELAERLTERDGEIVRLRTMLRFLVEDE